MNSTSTRQPKIKKTSRRSNLASPNLTTSSLTDSPSQTALEPSTPSNVPTVVTTVNTNSHLQAASLQGAMPLTFEIISNLESAVQNEAMANNEAVSKERRNAAFHVANHDLIGAAIERQSKKFFDDQEIPRNERTDWLNWEHARLFKVLKAIYRPTTVQESSITTLCDILQKLSLLEYFGVTKPGKSIAETVDCFPIRVKALLTSHGIENFRDLTDADPRNKKIVSTIFDRFKDEMKHSKII